VSKNELASMLSGVRLLSLSEFRALMARLGFGLFEPEPFDLEHMEQVVDGMNQEGEADDTDILYRDDFS
jgi:hypothetical protein